MTTGWTIRGSHLCWGRGSIYSASVQKGSRARSGLCYIGGSFPGLQQPEGDICHLYLVLSLRVSGGIPPFSLCAFMVCIGTDLLYLFTYSLESGYLLWGKCRICDGQECRCYVIFFHSYNQMLEKTTDTWNVSFWIMIR